MAIINNITIEESEYGVSFDNAYHRITATSIHRMNGEPKFTVAIDLAVYASDIPTANTRDILMKRYTANLEEVETQVGDSFLAKCYSWIMVQEGMTNSKEA